MSLTAEQKDVLNNELSLDPANKGYADMLPDRPGHVVDALNAETEDMVGVISKSDLATWAASTGMRVQIQAEADDPASPLCASAMAIIDVLRGASEGIDLSKSSNMEILTGWVSLGKLSTGHRDMMLAYATRKVSRAKVLGLPYITKQILRDR